jgi:rhodanese-related sulfurtransferase
MVETITAEKLKEKIENKEDFRLIEVLLPGLFDDWHIPGAINIPADDMKEIAPGRLKRDEEIIVYCKDLECGASMRAANALLELGYKKIIDFAGGKKDWIDKGYPIEK